MTPGEREEGWAGLGGLTKAEPFTRGEKGAHWKMLSRGTTKI